MSALAFEALPLDQRQQIDTEMSLRNLFADLERLHEIAADPHCKRFVQENFADLIEARDMIDAILKEAKNG